MMIYVAGHEVKRWNVPASTQVQRFHEHYPLVVANDTYAVVRVEGDHSLAPVVGGGLGVSVTPFALTNPIFLDSDGNGVYDPVLPHGPHVTE
ncbi:MAG: hypothetical protein ABIY55_01000 [Kofleriaceae bacterium]